MDWQTWASRKLEAQGHERADSYLLPDGATINVAGESHYQDALAELAGGKTETAAHIAIIATLHAEPDNPFDPNAVRIEINGNCVGYLPRAVAPGYAAVIAALVAIGRPARCRGFVTGGWKRSLSDEGQFGLVLELAAPAQCLRAVLTSPTT